MAFTSKQVTVTGTAAVLLHTADTDGNTIWVSTEGNGIIHYGGPDVTASTGMHVDTSKHTPPIEIKMGAGESLYAICDTGQTIVVGVLVNNW